MGIAVSNSIKQAAGAPREGLTHISAVAAPSEGKVKEPVIIERTLTQICEKLQAVLQQWPVLKLILHQWPVLKLKKMSKSRVRSRQLLSK